jgi:hypothetical protein
VNVALVAVVELAGPESMTVCGGVVSAPCTVQVRVAGVGSAFPEASLARTSKVCPPAASAE